MKYFASESENEHFNTDDLLEALPRIIVKNQRTYSFRLFPAVVKDTLIWNAMYRCDTNNDFLNSTGDTPRIALVNSANLLLTQKLVAEIKTTD